MAISASALIWAALASTRLMVRSAARAEIVGCALCLVLLVESRAFALSDALVAVATWLVCLGVVLAQLALVAGKKGLVHDSVVANGGQARTTYGKQYHREYIVYDRGQSYPEYVVYFKDG